MVKKVLLIDDEEDFCFFVKKNLELGGRFNVVTATDGSKAVDLAKEQKPDIILLDIVMPKVEGGDVCRMLSDDEATQNIPVLFLTGIVDKSQQNLIKEIKGHKFLAKPITPEELIQAIDDELGAE